MKKESLIINYTGNDSEIDVVTLVTTLVHYEAIIKNINQIAGDGHREIELKVKGLERGSFKIDILLVEKLIDMFSTGNVGYLASVVVIIKFIFDLYKRLKGKPICENEIESIKRKIDEINKDKDIKIDVDVIVNSYNSQNTRSSISKTIAAAKNDKAVTGIELINNGSTFVEIDESEFAELIYDDFDKEVEVETIKYIIAKDAILRIITLSFESKKSWEFIFNGFPIKLPVQDATLSSLIDEGMSFSKGDALNVDLEIMQEYDPKCDAYRNKKFRIDKFIKHIPRPEQNKLDFND